MGEPKLADDVASDKADNDHWLWCGPCQVPVKLSRYSSGCLRLWCPECGRQFIWRPPPAGGEIDGKPPFLAVALEDRS